MKLTTTEQTVALSGAKEIELQLNDGTPGPVRVAIRQLRVSQFADWYRALNDVATLVALYLDKPAAYVDTLTQESALAVLDAGADVNSAFFALLRRQVATWQRIGADAAAVGSPSQSTSPTPPPPQA